MVCLGFEFWVTAAPISAKIVKGYDSIYEKNA